MAYRHKSQQGDLGNPPGVLFGSQRTRQPSLQATTPGLPYISNVSSAVAFFYFGLSALATGTESYKRLVAALVSKTTFPGFCRSTSEILLYSCQLKPV